MFFEILGWILNFLSLSMIFFSVCVFLSFQNILQVLGYIWMNFGKFSKILDFG
jgi:hypothetical protein